MSDFKGRHFRGEIVLWAVRWYCRNAANYRDLEAMMTECGVAVDHSTIYRWVQCFAPEMEKRLRWQWRRPQSRSWRVDETYIKVRGKWATCTVRSTSLETRTISISRRPATPRQRSDSSGPERIEGVGAARGAQHRPGADLCRCHRGAQGREQMPEEHEAQAGEVPQQRRRGRPRQAQATDPPRAPAQDDEDGLHHDQGLRVMRALRKGQAGMLTRQSGIVGEARIVERAFGLGPCALVGAMALLQDRLTNAES